MITFTHTIQDPLGLHARPAGMLIKEVSAVCGGSGGGKPDSAMGGGKDLTKLDDALAIVDNFVETHIA